MVMLSVDIAHMMGSWRLLFLRPYQWLLTKDIERLSWCEDSKNGLDRVSLRGIRLELVTDRSFQQVFDLEFRNETR